MLAQDPTIIILDEATSALDARTEYEVVNAIRDRGITCIVIAHRLSTIRHCDRILVLDGGQIVEDGTYDELIADAVGLYAAYGHFDPEKEKMFLGVRGGRYIGGRLENYTPEPEKLIDSVSAELDRIKSIIDAQPGSEPFALIPALMKTKNKNKKEKRYHGKSI